MVSISTDFVFSNLLTFYNELLAVYDVSKSLYFIYLNFQKAFDEVPHYKLLHKIKEIGLTNGLSNG